MIWSGTLIVCVKYACITGVIVAGLITISSIVKTITNYLTLKSNKKEE